MSNVIIITKRADGRIAVTSPYNSGFIEDAKKRQGRRIDECWVFDGRDEDWVRQRCLFWYGSDGVLSVSLCTLRAYFPTGASERCGPIKLNGRTLARASDRDGGARLGDGVVIDAGKITSGGSRENWQTIIEPGTVLLVRDFIRANAENLKMAHPDEYEIVEERTVVNRSALEAERERLVTRLTEINTILGVG